MNNFTKVKALMISSVFGLSLFLYSVSGPILEMINIEPLELSMNQLMAVEQENTVSSEDAWNTAIEVANQN